ncbi:MAG: hypothetical protein ACRBCL_02940 [Maritimibacter sp.]
MADINYARFNKRLKTIERRHKKLSSGYVRLEERNGLLVPVQRKKTRRGFPVRGLLLTLFLFLAFKGFLLAHLGTITYVDRHALLEQGSAIEQMGAWAMRPDPLTVWISAQISPYL